MDDAKALAELFAAVAEERDWIATEPPVDIDARAAQFASTSDSLVVAEADSQIIGMLYLEVSPMASARLACTSTVTGGAAGLARR